MRYITLILLLALPLLAGYFGDNKQGVKAYNEGDYQTALDKFRSAQLSKPDSPIIRHNAALSIYRMGDYEKTIEELEKAYELAETDIEKADIQYDMGNTWFMQDSLQRAIMHYQKALEFNPEEEEAKYNLELARALIKEFSEKQQQQEQQNQQQQEQQQDRQDQQDQQEQQEQQDQQNQQQEQEQQQQMQERENPEDMTEEEAERLLEALEQDEEDLQKEKMKRRGGGRSALEKPW